MMMMMMLGDVVGIHRNVCVGMVWNALNRTSIVWRRVFCRIFCTNKQSSRMFSSNEQRLRVSLKAIPKQMSAIKMSQKSIFMKFATYVRYTGPTFRIIGSPWDLDCLTFFFNLAHFGNGNFDWTFQMVRIQFSILKHLIFDFCWDAFKIWNYWFFRQFLSSPPQEK